jgi:hypothetical protein
MCFTGLQPSSKAPAGSHQNKEWTTRVTVAPEKEAKMAGRKGQQCGYAMDKACVIRIAESVLVAVGQLDDLPVEWRGDLIMSEVLRRVKKNLPRLSQRQRRSGSRS